MNISQLIKKIINEEIKKSNSFYNVEITYHGFNTDLDHKISAIAKKFDGNLCASGAGFGGRDLSYSFNNNYEQAQAFAKHIAKYKEVVIVEINFYDGDAWDKPKVIKKGARLDSRKGLSIGDDFSLN